MHRLLNRMKHLRLTSGFLFHRFCSCYFCGEQVTFESKENKHITVNSEENLTHFRLLSQEF